jgi:hypothetical protein
MGFHPAGSGTTIRHNTQNNTYNKGNITQKYNANTIATTIIQISIQYTKQYLLELSPS